MRGEQMEMYNADAEMREAIKALREARWRLNCASEGIREQFQRLDGDLNGASYLFGDAAGTLDVLASTIDYIATRVRDVRKRVDTL